MQHLRIGHIEYANCTPIFSALKARFDCSRYEFVTGVPSRLNAMLRAGEIDLSPSSSIEYALSFRDYCLLPDLSISAIGAVKSVFLYSSVPIESLDGRCIGLTADSDTSVRLLKVLLSKKYGFRNSYERSSLVPSEAVQKYPAVLTIGDAALKAAANRGANLVYDLGELWQEFTGLPFVFALWIVRRDAVGRLPADMARLAKDLVRAKEYAYAHYREIAETCTERKWMEPAVLEDYWRTISYDLTPAHLEGARTFFRYAHELGLLPVEPEIRFFIDEPMSQ